MRPILYYPTLKLPTRKGYERGWTRITGSASMFTFAISHRPSLLPIRTHDPTHGIRLNDLETLMDKVSVVHPGPPLRNVSHGRPILGLKSVLRDTCWTLTILPTLIADVSHRVPSALKIPRRTLERLSSANRNVDEFFLAETTLRRDGQSMRINGHGLHKTSVAQPP